MTIESEPIDDLISQQFDENSVALEGLCLNSGEFEKQLVEMEDEIETMKKMGLPAAFGPAKSKAKAKSKRKESQTEKTMKTPVKKQKTEVSAKSLQRFKQRKLLLFSKWSEFDDHKILIDDQMYYSITPEEIAEKIAIHCKNKADYTILLDGFCGVGGNLIQFAVQNENAFVIGIDSSFDRVRSAMKIAKVYGVEHRCDFICGDFFKVAPSLAIKPDVVFLSPPWGGKKYKLKKTFELKDLPVDGNRIFEISKQLTDNIAYYLPFNQDLNDLDRLNEPYTLDQNVSACFGLTLNVFFGNLIDPQNVRPLNGPLENSSEDSPEDNASYRLSPAIQFAEYLNPIRSASFTDLTSSAHYNSQHFGETSPSPSSKYGEGEKDGRLNDQTANCSGMRLRSGTEKKVLKSDLKSGGKFNSKNLFKKSKKLVIAEVLRDKKCCLM